MKEIKKSGDKNDYKIIISEIGVSLFRMIKIAFALMGVIPLLVVFYIMIGKYFLYELFLGNDVAIITTAIFISVVGFLYAYSLMSTLIEKLLKYAEERKRSDSEKTELMIAIAHDLKTPLTTIKISMHNLIDGIGGKLSDAHIEISKKCLNAVEKVHNFIEEILNFSKIDFLRTQMERSFMDFGTVVKREIDGVTPLAVESGLNLNCNFLTDNTYIWGDEKKLSRATMNLLSNAVKYTPQGGAVKVMISGDDHTVQLSIANTGPGLTQDELNKIFKKYERLDRHSGINGIGLGLSMVKDIIDLHNGHIVVNSEPDKETEFRVVLPRDLRVKALQKI